eukprot:NODE_8073_length_566_cov_13.867882_g8050_i0.p1 GENE.NODE_8073_length_566_cov_13.867882_g8050_i0~~NODE_8073_length_566_cov_13.867882_g8050_i0.p1  ORF type:complete len:120 (-),score=10.42 NODE_8073_length_566_cov_13.867882_g8050_i0:134-493(-)
MTQRGVGIPVKLMHESKGHTVSVETLTGEVYRGFLSEAEDNMNCKINNLTLTHRDGKTTTLEQVYLRGSKIRFLVLPDMLKNAPMFKLIGQDPTARGRGMGYAGQRGGKRYQSGPPGKR